MIEYQRFLKSMLVHLQLNCHFICHVIFLWKHLGTRYNYVVVISFLVSISQQFSWLFLSPFCLLVCMCLLVMPSRNYKSDDSFTWPPILPLIKPRGITRVSINGRSIPQEFPWIGNVKLSIRFWSDIPTFSC